MYISTNFIGYQPEYETFAYKIPVKDKLSTVNPKTEVLVYSIPNASKFYHKKTEKLKYIFIIQTGINYWPTNLPGGNSNLVFQTPNMLEPDGEWHQFFSYQTTRSDEANVCMRLEDNKFNIYMKVSYKTSPFFDQHILLATPGKYME